MDQKNGRVSRVSKGLDAKLDTISNEQLFSVGLASSSMLFCFIHTDLTPFMGRQLRLSPDCKAHAVTDDFAAEADKVAIYDPQIIRAKAAIILCVSGSPKTNTPAAMEIAGAT
ncbi:hypothetical protein PMI41_00763 [Phyllobacterium sp. YR531]|nr:hypothetical protein PMI41_00763 [Phyllobacterium sp. YR531]